MMESEPVFQHLPQDATMADERATTQARLQHLVQCSLVPQDPEKLMGGTGQVRWMIDALGIYNWPLATKFLLNFQVRY